MLLNSIALRLSSSDLTITPRHQAWALDVFASIRSDLVPDFITKLKIGASITPEILLDITKKQLEKNRINDAALMIVRYKFQ